MTEMDKTKKETAPEVATARSAGLQYVTDQQTGIRRLRAGGGFAFLSSTGRHLKDAAVLKRIRSLAVPPAWKDVWICPSAHGHIQATGRDARGRKQYRYHRHWHEARDEKKFDRMIAFGRVLPRIRHRVRGDLRSPGLGRKKILAAIVRLLDLCAIRVGNDEYASHNNSYGLTTLRNRHAKVNGSTIHLRFRGKAGKEHSLSVEHPGLARIVKKCQDLPGQELFQWVDETGKARAISSGHVNEYLAEITGEGFTSKDFRTWTGTVVAALALREFKEIGSQTRARANIVRAIERVAARLGNTPAVCRKCYVHPAILNSYLDGTLCRALHPDTKVEPRASHGLRFEERAVLRLLKQQQSGRGEKGLRKKLRQSLSRAKARTRQNLSRAPR
jgi:DNA topoisomerase-1